MADKMADDQPPAPPLDVAALPDGFDRLLRGAVDVHVHGRPDLSAAFHYRGDDLAVARLAHAYGIAGWVLKSHLWITTDRAGMLRRQVADLGFEVHGSITLNPPMGGVCATVVELAAAHGARVVFLPTWGSDADTGRNGYISKLLGRVSPSFDEYGRRNAVSLLASGGTLTGRAREAVDACRDLGLSLATGHVSLEESEAVARYCADIGQRLMITHPMHYTADAGGCASSPPSAPTSSSATARSCTPTPGTRSATCTTCSRRSAPRGACSAPTPSPGGRLRSPNACGSSWSSWRISAGGRTSCGA
ncbi:DUF6282 family protein [Actinomadura madurae]|uniref:DUF6282 family protein n=1 Tax=Actinomadura madurae TaxID=1993 RepID=UPI0020D24B44|nr:DUF6282 family protein [Actinomadura madurae]MCQ0018076.1 DUF6282 family protein [Actinomadura madurae]